MTTSEPAEREVLEESSCAIVLIDGQGLIVASSEQVWTYFGYYQEEIVGQPVELLMPAAAQGLGPQDRTTAASAPDSRVMARGRRVAARRKNGTEFQADITLSATEDSTGRPVLRCLIRDTTRRSDEALRQSEERYRILFEDGLTCNFVSTVDGGILACNSAMATVLGLASAQEATSVNWMTSCADSRAIGALLGRLRAQRRVQRHPLELRGRNGRIVRMIANMVGVFRNEGDLFEIHGQLFDDTERYDLEQQLRQAQKMEAIGLLAGGISHDFNNQLTSILGFAELLASQIGPDKPMGSDLQRIIDAANRAAALTKQLLALGRRQVLTLTIVDMNHVVTDIRRVLDRVLGEKIGVTARLGDSLYPVLADASQLGQVLMNLVLNASDAMAGAGQLTIETSNVDLDADEARERLGTRFGSFARLRVRDTGMGMTPEVLARLFEPFFTTKERGQGTGLGLAVAYGIVKQLKGHITVDSAPGMGATFDVYLPRTSESVSAVLPAPRTRSGSAPGTETILLVEDEDSVRAFTKIVLERFGYHVFEANSAEAALAVLEELERPVRLLLSDVILPGMDGHELCTHIHRRHPALPVLFMSGYVGDHERIQKILGGHVRLLEKPFTAHELLKRIRELLDSSLSVDERRHRSIPR